MKNPRYTRQGLWTLFLMCAFPLHAWTLLLALRDFSWVSERTNAWDAVGVMSYGLVFALIESVVVWLVAVMLGFLISKKWEEGRRVALLSALLLVAAMWAIFGQVYFIWQLEVPGWIVRLAGAVGHPLRLLYGLALACVSVSELAVAILALRVERFNLLVREMIDRLTLLTQFYLLFDVIGLVIVVVRNV